MDAISCAIIGFSANDSAGAGAHVPVLVLVSVPEVGQLLMAVLEL